MRGSEPFRVVAEAMPHLAWVASPDGSIEYFNRPWLEYTGVTVERMRQGGVKGVVHPDDVTQTWERWSKSLQTGLPYEIQYRLRSIRDGSYRWFIARALPIRADDGLIVNWIGTATDIDEQVRANQNLRFTLDASSALASLLDVRQICAALAEMAISRVADSCFIALLDEEGNGRAVSAAHRNPAQTASERFRSAGEALATGATVRAAMTGRVATLLPSIDDAMLAGLAAQDAPLLRELGVHSMIVVPIEHEGTVYGAASLLSSQSAHTFTGEDLAVAHMVARRTAAAIWTAMQYEREHRRAARLRLIARASEMLFESFDLQQTFDRLTALLASDLADFAAVLSIESDDVVRASSTAARDANLEDAAWALRGTRLFRPEAEDRALRLLAQHAPRVFTDLRPSAAAHLVWEYLTRDVRRLDIRVAAAIPLHLRGETFGALIVGWCDTERAYEPADLEMLEDLGRRLSIAIEYARTLERERKIAQALQHALLPQPGMFPKADGLQFDAEYRPSSNEADVGGDWYDALTLPDGSIALSVGDVTGRGLHAAGLMGKLRQAVGMACLYEPDPARVLDLVDFSLRSRGSKAIATAFVAIMSPDRQRLRFAGAGHPGPLLRLRDGTVTELVSGGLPLGLRDLAGDQTREVSLQNAQLLILFTDGLTEATRDIGFGERRLRAIVSTDAILHVRNAARFICDACLPIKAEDDTAVLAVRFGEGTQWSFDAEDAQAAHEARDELMAYLRAHASPEADLEAAELVFGELVGNVVRHAPGAIDVRIDWSAERPILHVIDRGKGVLRNPSLPQNPLSESGRGLYIVSLLTRSLRAERIPGFGNHLAAELDLPRRE
ncbi:MAG TPA: SpoIIE family protein phosphatase [Candidatus Baltobacteraceae bacterium]|nr:SpoIIE family protein phosphatase [Candidatus Baltobacteraceae bacterium]